MLSNTLKTFFIGVFVMVACGLQAQNLDSKKVTNTSEMHLILSEDIGLSEHQVSQYMVYFNEYSTSLKVIRKDQSVTREQKKEKIMDSRKVFDQKLQKLMSPDQYSRYKKAFDGSLQSTGRSETVD